MVALLKMPRYSTPELANYERRAFERKEVGYRIEGRRLDHSLFARRQPHLMMDVRDLSVGGLSALTDMPLQEGERLAVSFPAQGLRTGWDALGRVLRCEASPMGYRVAIEFDTLPAA